jgi:uncharacterized Zn finger protein (UPF0148 family)
MQVRGERECTDCGAHWSYYETGSVVCPACGSVRSVGRDERALHTAGRADLDLSTARRFAVDDDDRGAAREARDTAREYLAARGFVEGGGLLDLDDRFLIAAELRVVADLIERGLDVREAELAHFLALLRAADEDGERPRPESVPERLRGARGLAYANAVGTYRRDLRAWLETGSEDPAVVPDDLLERLDHHLSRVEALDGEVPPAAAERLVEVGRALGRACRDGDADALATARSALDALE